MTVPKEIVDALAAGAAALITALVGVAIAALNAWRRKLEQERAVQAAEVAVRAVEQTKGGAPGIEKLEAAKRIAPAASDAMIEAAVHALPKGCKCDELS